MPGTKKEAVYKRVLLKLSGEALLGEKAFGIDRTFTRLPGRRDQGHPRASRWRSRRSWAAATSSAASPTAPTGMDRVSADHMGMLATVINALALQDALERVGDLHPRALRHRDARGGRALHPPPRHPPPREGARGHLRRRAPATPTSPPTRPRPCAPWRSRPRSSSRAPRSTASTTPTRSRTPRPRRFDAPHLPRRPEEGPQGDGHHRHLALHGQPAARSSSTTSSRRATCKRIVLGEQGRDLVKE